MYADIVSLYIGQAFFLKNDPSTKIIVVTGAGSGLGRASAALAAEKGDFVIAVDMNESGVKELEKLYPERVVGIKADVTNEESCKACAEVAGERLEKLGLVGIDCIINFAGLNETAPLLEMDFQRLNLMFDVNILGPLNISRAFQKLLKSKSGSKYRSKIINICSEVSFSGTIQMFVPYVVTKVALENISCALRQELNYCEGKEEEGVVDVVVVNPGAFDTQMTKEGMFQKHLKTFPESKFAQTLLATDKITNSYISRKLQPMQLAALMFEIIHTERALRRYTLGVSLEMRISSLIPQIVSEAAVSVLVRVNGGSLRFPKQWI